MPNSCAERPTISLCIGDERLSTGSAGLLSHVDPCSGEQDASVPLAGAPEIDRAVTKARAAYTDWCRRRSSERRDILLRLASLVEEHTDEFARRGTLDNGTTVTINRLMVTRTVEWIRYYAGWADKIGGAVTGSFDSNGEMSYVLPQPFGVIGCITTWNGPLISVAMKVAAALAAGNAVVVKPSEMTSGYLFTRDVQRAHRVAERLETGEVLINGAENHSPTRPFGGVGISGMGREGAREGLDEFLRTKTVAIGTL